MSTRATVRVTPEDETGGRPAADRLQSAARILEGLGFGVVHVGRFGVSIEGDDDRYHKVFGVQLPRKNESLVTPVRPTDEKLAALVDSLEITPEPEYYSRQARQGT
jgi:hypothetical protein